MRGQRLTSLVFVSALLAAIVPACNQEPEVQEVVRNQQPLNGCDLGQKCSTESLYCFWNGPDTGVLVCNPATWRWDSPGCFESIPVINKPAYCTSGEVTCNDLLTDKLLACDATNHKLVAAEAGVGTGGATGTGGAGTGGASTGGAAGATGTGGMATGGAAGTGGVAGASTGGAAGSTGGSSGNGGTATGGASGEAGAAGTGGVVGTGGTNSGGAAGAAGTSTGGSAGTGGVAGSGGASTGGAAGAAGTGGVVGTGGAATGGAAGAAGSTGGAAGAAGTAGAGGSSSFCNAPPVDVPCHEFQSGCYPTGAFCVDWQSTDGGQIPVVVTCTACGGLNFFLDAKNHTCADAPVCIAPEAGAGGASGTGGTSNGGSSTGGSATGGSAGEGVDAGIDVDIPPGSLYVTITPKNLPSVNDVVTVMANYVDVQNVAHPWGTIATMTRVGNSYVAVLSIPTGSTKIELNFPEPNTAADGGFCWEFDQSTNLPCGGNGNNPGSVTVVKNGVTLLNCPAGGNASAACTLKVNPKGIPYFNAYIAGPLP